MVHYATLITLFLATVAFARDNHNKRNCIQSSPAVPSGPSSSPAIPSPSGPSSSSVVSTPSMPSPSPALLVPSQSSPSPVISYVTVTVTKTIDSCPSPGSPSPGNPTASPNSLVESSPGPLSTSSPGYPKGDNLSSSLMSSSSYNSWSSHSSGTPMPENTPPNTLITLPSSTTAKPPSPSSSSSSSVVSSPTNSAPQPTYTGGYDRNAICGNKNRKRQPNPIEAAADFPERDLRRRIVH